MGKLGAFVPYVSAALGLPVTAVEAYVKPLRKAGLISTGGRGTAAPDLNARDIAIIAIAIMAGSPTHAEERVRVYGGLLACRNDDDIEIKEFSLQGERTLLDIFSGIIQSFCDGTFIDKANNVFKNLNIIDPSLKDEDGNLTDFGHYASIRVNNSSEVAFITLRCICNSFHVEDVSVRFLPPYEFDENLRRQLASEIEKGSRKALNGALYYEANIGPVGVEALGLFLRAKPDDG